MSQSTQGEIGPIVGRFDSVCRALYELALLLSILTIAFAAVQGPLAKHLTIDHVVDASRFSGSGDEASYFAIGSEVPIYRFHEDWQQPIGWALVDRVDEKNVQFHIEPAKMTWPVGRQGKVLSYSDGFVRVDVGSNLGFKTREDLNVFRNREFVGVVSLVEVGPGESVARLTAVDKDLPRELLVGSTVSEYSKPTQAIASVLPGIGTYEAAAYFILIVGYAVLWRRYRGSPLLALLTPLAAKIRVPASAKLVWFALIGLPLAWYLTEFIIRLLAYGIWSVYANFLHGAVPGTLTYDGGLQAGHLPLFVIAALLYEWLVWSTRPSPFIPLQRLIAFRGGIFGHAASDVWEHITMFCFQLIVVFMFARTIGSFLWPNLKASIAACWPDAPAINVFGSNPFNGDTLHSVFNAVGYALSHVPRPLSQEAPFVSLDYIVYDICIIPCLLGYGFSFLGYLWGKRIRNTDFTVVGWLTNGVCYTPLFGPVFWLMLPPVFGIDPTVMPSAFRTASFAVALFMNIVYTLSIWNLGVLFGVMTDKGVRRTGFYSVVRHPNYTVESIMFVVFYCRSLSTYIQWYAVCGFLFIYWLRAEREDQFMAASNPEYVEYQKQVPWKFIPGVY